MRKLTGSLLKTSLVCAAGAALGVPFLGGLAQAQATVSLDDAKIVVPSPFRSGMNIGCSNYYENCQILSNLIGYNDPGMEPGTVRQIQDLNAAGTRREFTDPNQYSTFPPGFWEGGHFEVVESVLNGAEMGCSGTIASSPGPNRAYVTEFSWDGNGTVTFRGANGFVAGKSTVVIGVMPNGSFLENKFAKVTSASPSSFSVTLDAPLRAAAKSSSTFGFVQTNARWYAPVYTIKAATNQGGEGCAAPFAPGDLVILSKTVSPTPETWWEGGFGGVFNSAVTGGAQMLSDTQDLCATCGSQALDLHFPAGGGTAQFWEYYDSTASEDIFVLMRGTYRVSFWAKAGSGSPSLETHAYRSGRGGFDCGAKAVTLTAEWKEYSYSCEAAESAGIVGPSNGAAGLQVMASALTGPADVLIDNVSLEKTAPRDKTNDTAFRDEIVASLRSLFPAPCSAPGTIRYWVNQNAETADNWTRPENRRNPTGTGYGVAPGGQNSNQLSLEEFLVLVENVQKTTGCPVYPYIAVPVTAANRDAAELVEFLAAPAAAKGSAYGQRRVALGHPDPWTGVFGKIYLSFCNECWNGSFTSQNIQGDHSGKSLVYYDYSLRSEHIFASMRGDPYYKSNLKLGLDLQTATNFSADEAIAKSHPDYVEIEDYNYGAANDFSTPAALWAPLYVEVPMQMTSKADPHNFYTSWNDYTRQNDCGPKGAAHCLVNIYEQGEGTISGSIANSQNDLDEVNAGAGYGLAAALQLLIHQQLGPEVFGPQNYFALTEFRNSSAGRGTAKLWGSLVDAGGASAATNAAEYGGAFTPRPQFLALELANKSIVGPMFSCPIASDPSYNFPGSKTNGPSGSLPARANVPYLYAFCFENGANRSLVFFNTDTSASHTVELKGSHLPAGTVTLREYSVGAHPNAMNEAHTGSYTGNTEGQVNLTASKVPAPQALTLPPYSILAIDYSVEK